MTVILRQTGSLRKTKFDIDFKDLAIKGRSVRGNLVTKLPVKAIKLKEAGVSTLKPRQIWYDPIVKRLNTEERGQYLGEFSGNDQLVMVLSDGRISKFVPDLEKHFPDNILFLEKYVPRKPVTAAYYDADKKRYFIKRFLIDDLKKEEIFIPDNAKLIQVSYDWRPVWQLHFAKERGKDQKEPQDIDVENFIGIKGIKAQGNLLSKLKLKKIEKLASKPYQAPEEQKQESADEQVTQKEVDAVPFEIKTPDPEDKTTGTKQKNDKKPGEADEPPTLF